MHTVTGAVYDPDVEMSKIAAGVVRLKPAGGGGPPAAPTVVNPGRVTCAKVTVTGFPAGETVTLFPAGVLLYGTGLTSSVTTTVSATLSIADGKGATASSVARHMQLNGLV